MIERQLHGLTQHQLAKMIGTTQAMISSWERGEIDPSSYYRAQLCTILKKSPEELELLPHVRESGHEGPEETLGGQRAVVEVKDQSLEMESLSQQSSSLCDVNIPVPHDAFFTGRDRSRKNPGRYTCTFDRR